MERVCEELDAAKTEIEKLREEIKTKSVDSETLKRAHNEQLAKIQVTNAKLEKQARDLNEKTDELSATKQMYEELQSSIKEKESIIKHLSCANDKLRNDLDEKLTKCEDEKKELIMKLDNVDSKNMEFQQEVNAYKEEIKGLKSLLSTLENKCLEVERKAKASEESGQRDDMFFKLQEEHRKVEDQLKWKREHFKHLEEAHEKLRAEFNASEKEWQTEKSMLLDEMYKLQEKLDSQTRISEDLQNRLQMCHQALAHEESRRKVLEVQFLETKKHFDSVLSECDEAKMEIESITGQRDKDLASLRDLLGRKEMVYKEMEYRVGRLEQENEDLHKTVKELQEAHIHEKGASFSLSKLQNKLKGLEKAHKDCPKNMREKEDEWVSKLERMDEDLHSCKTELKNKDEIIRELEIKCDRLVIVHQDCCQTLRAKDAEWAIKLEKVAEDLHCCKTQSENKDEIIEELQMKCENLDLVHRDCYANLKAKDDEWAIKLEKLAEGLADCKSQLENKDEVIKELDMKCECLNRVHQGCSLKLSSKEAHWTAQLESMAEDLSNCKKEIEGKDEVIRELEIKCEALDRIHRDCSSKLKLDENQWTSQLENLAEDLSKCNAELESKDQVIKELEMKFEGLDQVHRGCATALRLKEAEWTIQSEKIIADLVECRTKLESKDEVIKELRVKMEILDQIYKDCSTTIKAKEADWASQFEKMGGDLSDCRFDLECKIDAITQLKAELEVLKQMNEDTSAKLRAREAEWSLQLERMAEDLAAARSEIDDKDEVMKELQMALEDSNFSNMQLELQNEEKALMSIVFKSVIADMNMKIREREENVSSLMTELELKSDALVRSQKSIEENDENLSLSSKIESLSLLKDELESKLREVCIALSKANDELAEMFGEVNELEFELYVWRSTAEKLNANSEQFTDMRKELEASLIAQTEIEDTLRHEKENLVNFIKEKDRLIECLEQELKASRTESRYERENASHMSHEQIECLEQEWLGREFEGAIIAHTIAERVFEQDREDLCRKARKQDRRIEKKQEELNMLLKAWEKIATDELAKEVEIQEKTLVIGEVESDLENLQRKFNSQQKHLFVTEKEKEELAAEISAQHDEVKDLKSELQKTEKVIGKLESDKRTLFEEVSRLSERISYLTSEDTKLASSWERIVQKCDNEEYELYDPSKENLNSPNMKMSMECTDDGRSPLRTLNN